MAQKTRAEILAANAALFTANGTKAITGPLEKAFNEDFADSVVFIDDVSGNLSADTDFLDKFVPDGTGVTDITINAYYYSKIGKVVNITVVGALEYTDGNDGSFTIPIPPGYTLDELYFGYSLIFRTPEFQQSLQGEIFVDKVDAETLFLQFNNTQTLTVDFTLLITIWVA